MAKEEIEIDLKLSSPTFFQELDQRFASAAGKFTDSLKRGGSLSPAPGQGVAGFGKGLASSLAQGSGVAGAAETIATKGLGGALGGAVGQAALAAVQGAGAGIAATPQGALNSPEVLASRGLEGAVGGLIKGTVGKVPIIGDYINAQWDKAYADRHEAYDRAEQNIGAYAGNLARYGVTFSDRTLRAWEKRDIAANQRERNQRLRAERIGEQLQVERVGSLNLNG